MTALKREALGDVAAVDAALTEIELGLDLLLNLTPVNAAEAWTDFEKNGFATVPTLRSRPLDFEPDVVLRDLYAIEIERVEEPALAELFRDKRDEIARQVVLLKDRDTSRFLHGSIQLFGEVGDGLVEDAHALLKAIPNDVVPDRRVTAAGFAEAAQEELDLYRDAYPGFAQELEVRSDVSDLMVSHGRLVIPAAANFRRGRVQPLIQHEVGTHIVTFANGSAQPLSLLTVGLPGYEETQEGLAVLAEYAVDGLDPLRLRLLAGRVLAVKGVIEGASFLDVFEELHGEHGFNAKTAWGVTIRVTRSGGLTKDVIYLRGISRVLEFVAERKDLSPLLVGKLSLEHVPLIEELLESGFLKPPWIQPRWIDMPVARDRLKRAYEGLSVTELLDGKDQR
jgi:uncharacterized protein (TIGR02421 family)